jgi:integrase/recombinase XerD
MDLVVDGMVRADRPIMLVKGRVEPVPSLYLARRAGPSSRTAWTYARALLAWWNFLVGLGVAWWEVTESDIRAFGQAKSRGTARVYMTAVSGFYKWVHSQGFMDYRPFQVVGRHWSPGPDDSDAPIVRLPRASRRQPKSISSSDFVSVLAASPRRDKGLLLRDELTAECGHYIGLRRRQVRGLTVGHFHFDSLEESAFAIDLDPKFTKGEKEYPVLVPRQLVHKVRKYIDTARATLIERCRERNPQFKDPGSLFLTSRGTEMSESYISTTWRRAARRAGINKRFHANRHATGTGVAAGAMRFGIRPLRAVMAQLGHSSERSSQTYIHVAELQRELMARAHVINDRWERDHRP